MHRKLADSKDKVVAVSLDDWVVEPVSLDSWVVEEEKQQPVVEAVSLDDWVVEPVSLDSWVVEEEDVKPVILVKEDLKSVIDEKRVTTKEPEVEIKESSSQPIKLSDEDLKVEEKSEPIPLAESDLKVENEEPSETEVAEESSEMEIIEPAVSQTEEASLDLPIALENDSAGESTLSIEEATDVEIEESDALNTESKEEETSFEIEIDSDAQIESEEEKPVIEAETPISIPQEAVDSDLEVVTPIQTDSLEQLTLNNDDLIVNHQLDSTGVLCLHVNHLHNNSQLEVLKLTDVDLAVHYEPVMRLNEDSLFTNSDETVLRMSVMDKKVNHRLVQELPESFFAENDLKHNAQGALILLRDHLVEDDEDDLLEDEDTGAVEEEPKRSRSMRPKREVKKGFSDKQIIRYSMYTVVAVVLLLPVTLYFKFSWTNISQENYTMAAEEDSMAFMKHRTPDSSFRWFGRQLLNQHAYEKASDEHGFLTWFLYKSDAGIKRSGDDYP